LYNNNIIARKSFLKKKTV